MPQPIYMPADPSGWGNILSGGIDSFTASYLKEQERKQQANRMLLEMMMQYGGTVSPEQMGQIESSIGLGQSPLQKFGGKIGSALGITPEPKPYESPLRRLFEPMETGGYKIKGQAERGLETFRKQKEIEEPFAIGAEKRRIAGEKEITTFRTDEEIRGELKKLDVLEPKKRAAELNRLRAAAEQNEQLENKFFGSKLERLKKEKIATGDIATVQAIDLLQKEAPIKWDMLKKEIELRGEEARKTERVKLEKEVAKEDVAAKKERKADYNKTMAAINTAVAILPGEEVTDEEIEKIGRIAASYGFDIEQTPIKKTRAGVDWLAADKWTYRLIDPETKQPVKVYEENLPREKGLGYFGELQRPGGGISTELSIGVEINGKEIEIPSLVPTLTEKEKNYLLGGGKVTKEIVNKAVIHAKKRIAEGKDPFAQTGEQMQKPTYKYNPATGKLEKRKLEKQ